MVNPDFKNALYAKMFGIESQDDSVDRAISERIRQETDSARIDIGRKLIELQTEYGSALTPELLQYILTGKYPSK